MNANQKHEVATNFQKGKYKGLAATIKAAGTGLTLTYTDHVVFNDLNYVPSNNLQAEDRACRIGQKSKKVVYYHLVADHPLDRHIHRLVLKKMKLAKDTLEVKEEKPVEEQSNEEMIMEAVLSRISYWKDLMIKKWKVKAAHKKNIKKDAQLIVDAVETAEDNEETHPYEARDLRILRLLLMAGLETEDELRIAAGILKKYLEKVSPSTKKMLKAIDTTQG
jgi:hypothetical protein